MCGELEYRINLSSIWTTALLHGVYVMLFAGSIYVLVWRRPNTRYLVATVTLFALATIYTAANFLEILLSPVISSSSFFKNGGIIPCDSPDNQAMFHEISHELVLGNAMEFLENCVATALLSVADGLLIYRCFVLWGSRKYIVTLPLVLLLATTVCNITGLYYNGTLVVLQRSGSPSLESQEALGNRADLVTNIGIWFSLATNVITTFLSALRIWIMTRDIKIYLGPGAAVKYYSAIAMVVESGALSSTSLLVNSIVQSIPEIDFVIASTINQQLLAIAPTLIIVRVGMGKGFDDVQDSLHATRVANDRTSASPRFLKGERGLTSTISGMHFRTVEEAEPTTSRADHDGKDREDVPVPLERERIALGDGAIV